MTASGLLAFFFDPRYLLIFAVLALLLFVAQIYNRWRVRSPRASATDVKVKVIISSWWRILVAVFFIFWAERFSALPLLYLFSLFAIKEYVGISALRENQVPLLAGACLGATLQFLSLALGSQTLFFLSLQLYTLAIVIPCLIFTSRQERLAELIAFYLAMMILAVFVSYPLAILVFLGDFFREPGGARLAVICLIVTTELNDVFQFVCGKILGKRKVIPRVSPNKTEAGFIGGALSSTLLATFLWPTFLPVSRGEAAALGLLLSIAGMLGDLVCSAVKRYRGAKDFSDFIPGHGGVIDRIDSLLMTAPIFFFFVLYLRWVRS